MKRYFRLFALTVLSFALTVSAEAQTVVLDNGRQVSCREAQGQDQPYPFDLEEPVPTAPKGYSAFFVEHYGRHGSRFAYDDLYYDIVKQGLDQAEAKGLLTPVGKALKADYDSHYPTYHVRMGDLTGLGWQQQIRLGRQMAEAYPNIFRRKDAGVFAVSSDSRRSMMSMSGFCLGLGQAVPSLNIREDQGYCHLDATQPKSGNNPNLKTWPQREFPFAESVEEFCLRKTGACPNTLSRIFADPEAALEGIGVSTFVRKLYIVVVGMNSLEAEDRTDFSGIFTDEDLVGMWEVDNYQRYTEYYNYPIRTTPTLEHMIDDADDAIREGRYGAYLRFGHDHVVLPLLVLMRLNGYTREPESADAVSSIYAGIDCPMAGNVQIVLYRSAKNPDILVNIRLNGRNATVDGLDCVCPGFYRWEDYKSLFLNSRGETS